MAGAARTVKQGENAEAPAEAPVAEAQAEETAVAAPPRREPITKPTRRQPLTRPQLQRPIRQAPVELSPIASNRPTYAWYFRPPIVSIGEGRTTGLPGDCFYTASSWQPNQVEVQTRKVFTDPSTGAQLQTRLVNPIDRFGMKVRGVPVVAMRPPNWTLDSTNAWEEIIELLDAARPLEIEVEEGLLEAVKEDIESGALTQALRNSARDRQRALEARLDALRAPVDEAGLFEFFTEEARRSQETLIPDSARMQQLIERGVEKALAG